MASTQDLSLNIAEESTYKTYVAGTNGFEAMPDLSHKFNKNVAQGQGLRVGSRVDRAGRRVVTYADGTLVIPVECVSKGMGKLWKACLGAGVSTVVSGATYQHNFTLADNPASLSAQVALTEAGGTQDAFSWLGVMVDSWELAFPNGGIATLKATCDAGDISTAQTYVAPSYPTTPNLFHFAGGSISTGTFTAATTTTLPSAATPTTNIRGGVLTVNNNLTQNRYNFGGAGRKNKPTVGKRVITGTLDIEYDSTTYRDLILNDGSLTVVLTITAGALSTGLETLCVALPAVKFESDLPQPNGTDLMVQSMAFTALDDLTNPPIGVYMRTADATV